MNKLAAISVYVYSLLLNRCIFGKKNSYSPLKLVYWLLLANYYMQIFYIFEYADDVD